MGEPRSVPMQKIRGLFWSHRLRVLGALLSIIILLILVGYIWPDDTVQEVVLAGALVAAVITLLAFIGLVWIEQEQVRTEMRAVESYADRRFQYLLSCIRKIEAGCQAQGMGTAVDDALWRLMSEESPTRRDRSA